MTTKRKRVKKYYLVLSKDKNYRYGVFPHTPDGLNKAKDFVKNKESQSGDKLYIVEK